MKIEHLVTLLLEARLSSGGAGAGQGLEGQCLQKRYKAVALAPAVMLSQLSQQAWAVEI